LAYCFWSACLLLAVAAQAALAGAVICLAACVGYCIYSVLFPGLQKRRIDAARRKVSARRGGGGVLNDELKVVGWRVYSMWFLGLQKRRVKQSSLLELGAYNVHE
jgi:hypothetical protein